MIATSSLKSICHAPTVERMMISPEQALIWLETSNPNNRRVSDKHVRRLARDMKEGKWRLTHSAIAFSPNGTLLDGQHRLWAIVESGVAMEMFVARGVDPECMMAIDYGKTRSMADILNIAGENGEVNNYQLAAIRVMLGGYGDPPVLSPAEMSQVLLIHHDAIQFALANLPSVASACGVNSAATRGVVARAYYSVDHAALKDFCRKLTTGVVTSEDEGVIVLLRQQLQSMRGNSYSNRMQRYGKTERVLSAWLKGLNPKRLYSTSAELFPLPEEVAE